LVSPVEPYAVLPQTPGLPNKLVPLVNPKPTIIPAPLVEPTHVPAVAPEKVITFLSHVFAVLIVYGIAQEYAS